MARRSTPKPGTFGYRLREAREARHLTQAKLAEAVGAETHASVGNWEYNRNPPTLDNLVIAAQLLQVSLDWLVFGVGMKQSIDARIRAIPKVLRAELLVRLHEEIDRTVEAAKRLPPELLAAAVPDDDDRLLAWSAKGKAKRTGAQ